MPQISLDDVELRDLGPDDVEPYVDYWHNPENTALDALGIDRAKVYPAKKMREMLALTIASNAKLERSQQPIVCIVFRGRTIGVHDLTELGPGDSAVMHAHIWNQEFRGLGIGLVSYVKAMELYFERFALETIRFETPKVNAGANRIKAKLGLEPRGSGLFNLPMLKHAVETNTYVVERAMLPELLRKVGSRS
jgi:RimJ/RimL family protein N-acetyltransferase